MIFVAALELRGTDRTPFQVRLLEMKEIPLSSLIQRARAVQSENGARLFLVDGLETAFDQAQILVYISALVQFMSTIDGDDSLRAKARLQVFLRTDLAVRGYENFEQLSQGRTLTLEWDAQAILNFVLSRIVVLEWFKDNFSSAVTKINAAYPRVHSGSVEISEAEELLLQIFPERLRRLNLKMTTFMRTYFSDDPSGMKSFYPRIYDEFLTFIDDPTKTYKAQGIEETDGQKRVSQQLIYAAHENATTQFLQQVRSELPVLGVTARLGARTPPRCSSGYDDSVPSGEAYQRDLRQDEYLDSTGSCRDGSNVQYRYIRSP